MFPQNDPKVRQEFMFNFIIQLIVNTIIVFVLAWPMQFVMNWCVDASEFGTTIGYWGGAAFTAIGIVIFNVIPKLPIPFQFHKKAD